MFFGRGKNKDSNCYTVKDIYNSYILTVDKNTPYYMDYKTFKTIIVECLKEMTDQILIHSNVIKLPFRLGDISICKRKMKFSGKTKLSVNWKETNKLGKTVYYTNDHTNGFKYFFWWSKIVSNITNKTKYRFKPTRTNKRVLAYLIKNKKIDYLEK